MNQPTLLWYDYETFGAKVRQDRPAQIAMIRTDLELNIIEEPINIFCQPDADMVPSPMACFITGISPQAANAKGVPEPEFARLIYEQMMRPQTCVVGYNSIRFDDEIGRFLFYRNFFDPYSREFKNGNSRWDLLDVTRLCYALRPQGINWPKGDNGKTTFKLDRLCPANGIEHENAHDAVSDVKATIEFARKIKQAQPKLYDFAFAKRNKHNVSDILNVGSMKPIVHVSGMFPVENGCLSLVVPLVTNPNNQNEVICWDLSKDCSELASASSEELKKRLFQRSSELEEGQERIGLKGLHINKCPIVAPVSVLTVDNAERLGIDLSSLKQQLEKLNTIKFRQKLLAIYDQKPDFAVLEAQQALYDGFISYADRAKLNQCLLFDSSSLANPMFEFDDERLSELLFLYRAKHYPDSLNIKEVKKWREYLIHAFNDQNISSGHSIESALKECNELIVLHPNLNVLHEVQAYLNDQKQQREEILSNAI
ncbi:MAG: exodeoxyribonuclease I [Saccharospirillaceae bacterium]|nr:exodeoxyribonuclease I [Pseudomonadales bacterium]NRB79318.1 exodeoxyribonuclease I [Saccharospirillaceae bacterium]